MLESQLRDDGTPAVKRLMSYFQHWLDSQLSDTTEDKCLVVKLSAEVTDLSESMRRTLNEGTGKVIARISKAIEEAVDSKELVISTNADALAQELYYMWVGATLLTKVSHTRDALECAMQATRKRLTHG